MLVSICNYSNLYMDPCENYSNETLNSRNRTVKIVYNDNNNDTCNPTDNINENDANNDNTNKETFLNKDDILIYLVRHGRTEKNLKKSHNEISSDKNSKLDHIGRLQSIIIGQYFYSQQNECKLVAVYSSPRIRTMQTLDLILTYAGKNIEMQTDERLVKSINLKEMEINFKSLLQSIYNRFKGTMGSILLITHNHIIDMAHKIYSSEPNNNLKVDNCSISCLRMCTSSSIEPVYWDKTVQLDFNLV